MSPISAGLDGLLALLLVAALVLGVRLNARLKALRDGQAGFAAAVLELNRAAASAEAGLKALKTAQADAHDELLSRIEVARGLAAKLERVGEEVERRTASSPARPAEPPTRASTSASGGALAAIAALAEGRGAARSTTAFDPALDARLNGAETAGEPRAAPPPRRKPARGAFDEELFEAKPARRDDPLGLGALHREPAPAAPPPAPVTDLGPLEPRSPVEDRQRLDPLRNWKAVR